MAEVATGLTRRRFLGIGGAATAGLLTGCGVSASEGSGEERKRPGANRVTTVNLHPEQGEVDLGGRVVTTWSYGGRVPGREIRLKAGEVLRARVHNHLPEGHTTHWHGIRLVNEMDGVPYVTQPPIQPGSTFRYEFVVPDPGTYWFHAHVGMQIDRGLSGPLIVEDPNEALSYDEEWTVMLDDWLDGVGGRSPVKQLHELQQGGMHMHMGGQRGTERTGGTGGMERMGGMSDGRAGGGHQRSGGSPDSGGGHDGPLGTHVGDVDYPYYLINGRTPDAPAGFRGKPGQRVRVRFVNAGGDTTFRVAIGGHRMTVTHTDGWPVEHVETGALLLGTGERYDVLVTLSDGVFPIVAHAEGKGKRAFAVVRTAGGRRPEPHVRVPELWENLLWPSTILRSSEDAALPAGEPGRVHDVVLGGNMMTYVWTINGKTYEDAEPLLVDAGEKVRLRFENTSMMPHPMHTHGHTFQLQGEGRPGARKDTVIVPAKETAVVDLVADNPGHWLTHCHNAYHMESGMMTLLNYRA